MQSSNIRVMSTALLKIAKILRRDFSELEKIQNSKQLRQIVEQVLNSNQKTILFVIFNSQNQRRYIGVKLK